MIVGVLDLNKKLHNVADVTEEGLRTGIEDGIKIVHAAAQGYCPVGMGPLRESITTEIKTDGEVIKGICWPQEKEYALYVEFGTGPKGQADHEGISPDVAVAYTQSPWWIHESQIDKATAEKYHFFAIETKDGTFYQCAGQAAQPFMYPALKDNEDEIVSIVARAVRSRL